ncbi:hypothetical protein [Deinococcus cellulosilyticus]|uniref:Uncharacterized protein n=1 Tax=Deinococcus cellulosilyticus (strain DSM 18568 / NBRC 106333 / KACC 11606 / 5516J-15) TaxID=1223518 RepID=A0A511N954_DEIC1|nr:hypothetical protein [Deinococcus cellulosilyticus]GEM48921.1 hypothetical protein DC3_45560 [Deinococcus cellulosilyticus NBRC 106333 = KACC 11606]
MDFEAIKAQKGRGRGKLPYAEYTLTYSYSFGQQTHQRKVFLYSPSFYRWNSTDLVGALKAVKNGPTHPLNVPFVLMVDASNPEKSTIELRRDMSPFQTYWQLFCGSLLVSVVLFGLLRLMKITVFGMPLRSS